jgi:SagB-type dehydrogenase family enzyme
MNQAIKKMFITPKRRVLCEQEGSPQGDGSVSLGQMWMARAPVMFVITAEYGRITDRYGDRGIRYAQIEVGHVAQNLFLQSADLGLGAGIVGAFNDAEVTKALGVPRQHEPLLIMFVEYKK